MTATATTTTSGKPGTAYRWQCQGCGFSYESPIPILGAFHECRPSAVVQPKRRDLVPVEEEE